MFPLFPFALGIVTGVVSIKMLRHEKAKKRLEDAQGTLRSATIGSLNAIEKSSARLRDRLEQAPAEATPAKATPAVAKTAKKPAAKPRAAAKPKARTAKTAGEA